MYNTLCTTASETATVLEQRSREVVSLLSLINDGILKRETIQSSTAHVSPCQNVLSSLSAGKDTTFSHAVLSPLLLLVFLLCILVHMCNHSCFFFLWCVLFCCWAGLYLNQFQTHICFLFVSLSCLCGTSYVPSLSWIGSRLQLRNLLLLCVKNAGLHVYNMDILYTAKHAGPY